MQNMHAIRAARFVPFQPVSEELLANELVERLLEDAVKSNKAAEHRSAFG